MSAVLPIEPDTRFRRYTASAGQTQFAIAFPFQQEDDIAVALLSGTHWAEIDPSLYAVTGAEDPDGGMVTFTTGRTAGDMILVLGNAILDRLSSIVRDGRFSSKLTDDEFDRNRIIQQEQRRDIDRALKTDFGAGFVGAGIVLASDGAGGVIPGPSAAEIVNAEGHAEEAAASAELARKWAENPEDDAVTPGHFSALHWAEKAEEATTAGIELARKWAENPEDDAVTPGHYSAFHWAEKAAEVAQTPSPPTDNSVTNVKVFAAGTPATAIDSHKFFYQAPGVGAVPRFLDDRLDDMVYNVKDWGAKGDGITNDQPAIQACIDACKAGGGGTVYFPASAGSYRITSSLSLDFSSAPYINNRFSNRVNLKGDGSASAIVMDTASVLNAVNIAGGLSNNALYMEISGLRFQRVQIAIGAAALNFFRAAFISCRDLIIEGYDIGVSGTDLEQMGMYDCEIRFNNIGFNAGTGTMTSPNSLSFYNCTISNNRKKGLNISHANAFNFNGGSIQYNGDIGSGINTGGIFILDAGDGYGTVGFTNMIFEGNGGLGDFACGQSAGTGVKVSFQNCAFTRTATFASALVTGAANNGSGAIRLTVDSTANLVGYTKAMITGVVGSLPANNAIPWSFNIVDATHIDLVGSAFSGAYTSGGRVTVVGFGANQILMDGTALNCDVSIRDCRFMQDATYLPSASRKTINLNNINARITEDGTNFFQNAVERTTFIETQKLGDDLTAWAAYNPTPTGTGWTGTCTGRIRKVGKTVYFQLQITTTSLGAAAPPINVPMPWITAAGSYIGGLNITTVLPCVGFIGSGSANMVIYGNAANFPVNANGQVLIMEGIYETPI